MSEAQTMYLVCGHCKCEFLASKSQAKHGKYGETKSHYCSRICQSAGQGAGLRRPLPYTGVCPHCKKEFASRQPKKFCCMRCYQASPECHEMLVAKSRKGTAAMVLKTTGIPLKPRVEVTCMNCGAKRIVAPAAAARRKYCNSRCYRQYMAKRFDRWMASPEGIALPQCYDEFLSQGELRCLIEGCNWVGEHLGNHVNLAHGIPANEFKRAAGFNVGSGLVTPALSEELASRPHLYTGFSETNRFTIGQARPVQGYMSGEGREHRSKARVLKNAEPMSARICEHCGEQYTPGAGAWGAKYCTLRCRDSFYQKNIRAFRQWMTCATCDKPFQGNYGQHKRLEAGGSVVCSMACRQKRNAGFKRAAAIARRLNTTEPNPVGARK